MNRIKGVSQLRNAFKHLAISNLVFFLFLLGTLIPEISKFIVTVEGLFANSLFLFYLTIFLFDLFFTLKFIWTSWEFAEDRYLNLPVIIVYGTTSGITRVVVSLSLIFQTIATDFIYNITAVSSIFFGFILLSISMSEVGTIHKDKLQLIAFGNISGIGVFLNNMITTNIFLGTKLVLPLVTSIVLLTYATDNKGLQCFTETEENQKNESTDKIEN